MSETMDRTRVWNYECPVCHATFEPNERPEDGRCTCEHSPLLSERQSEFGAGVIVCLAKFSEHLWIDSEREAAQLCALAEGKIKRSALFERAELALARAESGYPFCRPGQDPLLAAAEDAVSMWASGAADHFYDLDRDLAPAALLALADLVMAMRNTHLDSGWTLADGSIRRVRELWRQACCDLDRQLGAVPNWGEC